MSYTEIAEVRKRGFTGSPPSDAEITVAIALASELINSWCGQDFILHEDEEIIADGNDGISIVFGKKIIAISELKINESVIPLDSIVLYLDCMIGEVSLNDGYWFYRGNGNVKMKADIGWNTAPSAIKEAASHLAAMIINRQLFSGRPEIAELDSEKLLDYARKRMNPSDIKGFIEHDPYLVGLLRPYRLKGVLS